jgi:hypothetical protein
MARPQKLLTKALLKKLPPLGATEEQGMDALALVKFFYPDFSWTWYGVEFDGEDIFFGLVEGFETEMGTFSLSELKANRGKLGLPIERDKWFQPVSLRELYEKRGYY